MRVQKQFQQYFGIRSEPIWQVQLLIFNLFSQLLQHQSIIKRQLISIWEMPDKQTIDDDPKRPKISLKPMPLRRQYFRRKVIKSCLTGAIDASFFLRQFFKVHQIDQCEIALVIDDETFNFEFSPKHPSAVHVLHYVDDTGREMFHYAWAQLPLTIDQIIEILALHPSAQEVYPTLIGINAVLLGDERMSQLFTYCLQRNDRLFHFFTNGICLFDDSHGKLDVALRFNLKCTTVVS
jgi:hypothetical protein